MANILCQKTVLNIFTVDAFTKRPFSGNPAAICCVPFDCNIDNDIKQKIAAEMNLSETAFLKIANKEDNFQLGKKFLLEWFTPKCQVPLCGHATLATAASLFFELENNSDVLEFKTLSGVLKAKRLCDDRIQIDLPAYESESVVGKYVKLIKAVVGDLPVEEVVISQSKKLLIRLRDDVTRMELQGIQITDSELLAEEVPIVGVIVTLRGSGNDDCADEEGNGYDFISRYFAPWFGISEDPVTGSAHSVLAPYWSKILKKESLYARQCSSRGGELYLQLVNDRVLISGDAVILVRSQITF